MKGDIQSTGALYLNILKAPPSHTHNPPPPKPKKEDEEE